jgi:hypothetical protein
MKTQTPFDRSINPEGIPVGNWPSLKFYAAPRVHEFLKSLPQGSQNRTINKLIAQGMERHLSSQTNDKLKRFAEFLKLPQFRENKPAIAISELLEQFYRYEQDEAELWQETPEDA